MLNENKKCITAFRWSNNNQICHQAPITIPYYGCFISNITFFFILINTFFFGRKKYRWRSNATLKHKKDMKIIIWDCREREREKERTLIKFYWRTLNIHWKLWFEDLKNTNFSPRSGTSTPSTKIPFWTYSFL